MLSIESYMLACWRLERNSVPDPRPWGNARRIGTYREGFGVMNPPMRKRKKREQNLTNVCEIGGAGKGIKIACRSMFLSKIGVSKTNASS